MRHYITSKFISVKEAGSAIIAVRKSAAGFEVRRLFANCNQRNSVSYSLISRMYILAIFNYPKKNFNYDMYRVKTARLLSACFCLLWRQQNIFQYCAIKTHDCFSQPIYKEWHARRRTLVSL